MGIIENARKVADDRLARTVPVDYAALNRMIKRQRAQLSRAKNSGDVEKLAAVVKQHVAEWDAPGAMWPDDWSHWQRTLDDALPWSSQVDIRDL